MFYIIAICLIPMAIAQYTRGLVGGSAIIPCRVVNMDNYINCMLYTNSMKFRRYIVYENKVTPAYRNDKAYLLTSFRDAKIVLMNLTFLDAGVYTCEEYSNDNSTQYNHLLITLAIFNSSIVNAVINATVGDSVELSCAFISPKWFFTNNGDNELHALPQYNTNRFTIYNVEQSNSGIYYCFKGARSYSIRLDVVYKSVDLNMYYAIIIALAILTLLLTIIVVTIVIVLCKRNTYSMSLPLYDI